ncbi:MAG TPA: extracellular solute-binding protein [Xanthobacteraceae bacterium]
MIGSQYETLGAAFATLAYVALSCATPAVAETMDELYAKAKAEKSLVFYSGGPVAPYEGFAREFEQRFPDLKVMITGGFSNVLNEKINGQLKERKLEVDMAFFQTAQDFVAWKKQGVLMNFKPEGFEQIAPVFRDPDGAFLTTKVNPVGYAYNAKAVAATEVPRSALDFLKPAFLGKLITCYPADDDATLYQFYTIAQKYGWSFMDKYMAAKPNFVQGHLEVARSIAAGTNIATFDSTATALDLKRAGQPIEFMLSADDPTPIFTLTTGIFKDAPHPNAAKLFLTWYMAKEQQSRTGVFSARTDVPPPAGFNPLFSYKLANDYVEFVTNAAQMADLRTRLEGFTGPVLNKGGVR